MNKILAIYLGFSTLLTLNCSRRGDQGGQQSPPPAEAGPVIPNSQDQSPAGITSQNGIFSVSITWTQDVKAQEFLQAQLQFFNAQKAKPKTLTLARFKPWMPSMGHGTSMDAQKITPDPNDPSKINVSNIYLIMAGPWEIDLAATIDGASDTVKLPVNAL